MRYRMGLLLVFSVSPCICRSDLRPPPVNDEDDEDDEDEEILGSDDDEQEDPKDYIKGG